MSDKPVEVAATAPAPEAVTQLEVQKPEAVEQPPAEAVATEAAQPAAVEAPPAVEAQQPEAAASQPEEPEAKTLTREEFARIADKFGDAIAAKVMREGGDYGTAMELAFEESKKEIETLRAKIAEMSEQTTSGRPVAVVAAKAKPKLFNTGK